MKNNNSLKNLNLPGSKNKLTLPLWLIFLFASIELIAIVQSVFENSLIQLSETASTMLLILNIFSIVVYLLIIIFLNKHLEKIIKIFAVIGFIATFIILLQLRGFFEIAIYLNSFITITNSFLILTYIAMYFSIKTVMLELLVGIFCFKAIANIMNNTIFSFNPYIPIILMAVCYILFFLSFIFFPKHAAKEFKVEKEEVQEKETKIAMPSKQPPYFLYILVIIFIGLISGLESITQNILIQTPFSNLIFIIGSAISAIFTFYIILKKDSLKFFDLMYLFLIGFSLALIFRFFSNTIVYYIGSFFLGLFSLPLGISIIFSAILFTKTNKITTPIWILCLNTISLMIWDEILSKIQSIQGLIIMIIPISILTAILLSLLKPHLNFAIQEHNFKFDEKNIKENPLSYLSEIELSFAILASEGYTINQITEQLNVTPIKMKEIKLRTYGMLQVKNKKEMVEKIVAYKI